VPHLRRRVTMIMQGTTPRSLSWLGLCAVLGLGTLLPLAPVQAQSKPAGADEQSEPQDSRDQQLEVLRKAIRILEEQTTTEKAKPTGNPAEIDDAKAALKRATNQLDAKRREFEEAAKRHHEAAARLARLEGRPVPPMVVVPPQVGKDKVHVYTS